MMADGLETSEKAEDSGYKPTAPTGGRTLEREASSVKTVDEMRLSELLKLSGALSRVPALDLGAVVASGGVGLAGAAIGAAATGEALLSGVPLVCLLIGIVGIGLGFALSRERGEEIGAIRRNLDFDIDSWCENDADAADLRDRYRQVMTTPSVYERVHRSIASRRARGRSTEDSPNA